MPLTTHKNEEGLTYRTVHPFYSDHPTVVILQMRRTAYPNVHTFNSHHPSVAILQMRIADLCHCAHF